MTKIAFLGLGAMGRRMATRLIETGHDVTVWNRTPGAADALVALGATAAATPQEAAQGAEGVLTMLTNDTASQAVWDEVLQTLPAHALAVEMSTVSPARIAELVALRPGLIDAPVAGSLPQAEAGELIFLAGGPKEDVDRFRPVATAMGKSLIAAGPSGKGAALKLAVNTALGIQTAMVAELQRLGSAHGIAPSDMMTFLGQTPVLSGTATVMGGLIAAERHPTLFPIDLLIKDLDYALDGAHSMPVTRAVQDAFRASSAAGRGGDNISAIAM